MMTKTVSLADDAYAVLLSIKRPEESFSDLARRLARLVAQERLFDPALRVDVSREDADELKRNIRRMREATLKPRV